MKYKRPPRWQVLIFIFALSIVSRIGYVWANPEAPDWSADIVYYITICFMLVMDELWIIQEKMGIK